MEAKVEQLERIERITEMEARMDRVQAAAAALEQALDAWEAAQQEVAPLARYYASPRWRGDFEADEAGELPPDLKRGVLSEDGLWNLLERVRELNDRLWTEE